ncbi:MAG: transcription antitermination factor NusB, partial [Parvularculaceae bacterium]
MAKTLQSGETPGLASRRASLDLLRLARAGRSLDEALAACRSFNALKGPDRSFARALASTVLRRRGTLDHVIGPYLNRPLPARSAAVMDILRLAGAQVLLMGTPAHAAVSTATSLAGEKRETAGYRGLVNAIARKLASAGPEAIAKLPARIDTPGWLWR